MRPTLYQLSQPGAWSTQALVSAPSRLTVCLLVLLATSVSTLLHCQEQLHHKVAVCSVELTLTSLAGSEVSTNGCVAQWQRVGFQTRRSGVQFPPRSYVLHVTRSITLHKAKQDLMLIVIPHNCSGDRSLLQTALHCQCQY